MVDGRENTIVVSSRMDARELAMMVLAWELELGSRPRSMSWLIREIVGSMADMMQQKHGDAVEVSTHQDAWEIIEGRNLRAHSTRSFHALSKGLQNEVLSPSIEDVKKVDADAVLLNAIKTGRMMGKSEEEITAIVTPMAKSLYEEFEERKRLEKVTKAQEHEETARQFVDIQQKTKDKKTDLTPEEKVANYEKSVVERLGEEWEGPIHSIVVRQIKDGYLRHFPDMNEAEFEEKLEALVERARPAIETRAERNRELFEKQEREKKVRNDAKAAVRLDTALKQP